MKITIKVRKNGNGKSTDNFWNPGQSIYSGTFLGLMLAFLFVTITAGAVKAATYTVTNNHDSGAGSLRQAIADANSNADDDIIQFAPSLSGQTITLTSGKLEIFNPLTINGLGASYLTLDGNNQSTVIDVWARAAINGIRITGGNGMYGGAISNNNNLTVSHSTFSNNNSTGFGGGIFNAFAGSLTVSHSIFSNNYAIRGGGIYNDGALSISDSTFNNNSAQEGGGIASYLSVTIINSVFRGNSAQYAGGGIHLRNYYDSPRLTIINSTLSGNSAGEAGGGIYSENQIQMINSTVTGNSAKWNGGVENIVEISFLSNTIVAGNTATTGCPDLEAAIISQGHNLIGSSSCAYFYNTAAGDQLGTDAAPLNALLGPLQDNGGSTFTHALLPGSPAIDAGSNALAVDFSNNSLLTDQRGTGFLRIANTTVDIGAFELQQISDTTPPIVTPTISGTLGNFDWYVSNVSVSWSVTDGESPVSIQTGCGLQTVTSDTNGVTFTCSATSGGGTASHSVTVKRDATKPTLAPTVSPNPVFLGGTATAAANATDVMSGLASQSCGAVNTASVGNKTVGCTATDLAGNAANANASYQVVYNFIGFFSPVDNAPIVNKATAGSAIPVKFSLGGNQGLNIFAAGHPASQSIGCNSGVLVDEIEETVNPGGSSLGYDATSKQYNYVWKTDKSWKGTCRKLLLKFKDGTTRFALFQFK